MKLIINGKNSLTLEARSLDGRYADSLVYQGRIVAICFRGIRCRYVIHEFAWKHCLGARRAICKEFPALRALLHKHLCESDTYTLITDEKRSAYFYYKMGSLNIEQEIYKFIRSENETDK